jgi:hypothetical protein
MEATLDHAVEFFAMSRERYKIKQRRDSGQPWPWSEDPVFQEWRFTNVFREDDKTTTWFRENIRHGILTATMDLNDFNLRMVEATLIFRWFNRITTGELIKDLLIYGWNTEEARRRLRDVHPVVTGAYMIKTFNDMNKLDGILLAVDGARKILPAMVPKWGTTLEGAWKDLTSIYFLGGFMAHEIIQDLRYTPILDKATDILTWGHLGPGAVRGINWVVFGAETGFSGSANQQKIMLKLMQDLLALSRDPQYWPSEWPSWELHQVEFGLCEFSKYCKASRGIPQKRRYQQ